MRVLSLTSNENARFYVQQVAKLRDLGVDVTTVSVPGDQFAVQSRQGSRSPLAYMRFVPTVLRHAHGNYDLIHANYGLTAPAALPQSRLPVVLSLWGSDLMGSFGFLGKASARWCDEVIVMSSRMADRLGQPCHVVPHGIDLDLFEPKAVDEAAREVDWPDDTRNVFFPYSENRDVKNYPLAKRVVEAVDDVLEDDVRLRTVTGVPHDRMPYYYSAADALLLTSDYEGSPNSVKEAMACNLPVVATDVGDVGERLAGVSPSRVCDSEAELVSTLAAVLRADRRSNGRERIRELGLDRTAQQIKSVYESALE
jgi:glycosyltransferase involved in cell wall biosynthesis